MNFEEWLLHSGKTPGTAADYARHIQHFLSKLAIEAGLLTGSLEEITSPQRFATIAASLKTLPEFVHSNAVGKNKYSSALDRYAEYLAERSANLSLHDDLQVLASDPSITATTRTALIEARLGQGKFRAALIDKYGGRCAVTGVAVPELLRASHIKPWALASNEERLDPENGLLLTPTLDVLFDRGFISFRGHGQLLWLRRLEPGVMAHLGPIAHLQLPPSQRQARYLQVHATHHGRAA